MKAAVFLLRVSVSGSCRGRDMDRHERFDSASRVIQMGFWVNAGLMTMKLLAGHFGRSEAVFADGM
jgi:divalent metal cation (Fe/Co/Zn/Cd) transporter